MDNRKVFPQNVSKYVEEHLHPVENEKVTIPASDSVLTKKVQAEKKELFTNYAGSRKKGKGFVDWNSYHDADLWWEEGELVTYGY